MKRARAKNLVVCAGVTSVLGLLAACGEADELTTAVSSASSELSSLSPDGANAAPTETRRNAYDKVGRTLQGAASSSGPAAMLASQASAGAAQVAHHELRPIVSEVSRFAASIQSELGVYAMAVARAESASGYDAGSDREAVSTRMEELSVQIATAEGERNDVASRISDLREEAGGYAAEARSIRSGADGLRLEADRTDDGERRVELVSRAVGLSREADAQSRRADEILARADNLEPRLDLLEREVGRLTRQLESARTTMDQIDIAAESRRERARLARAEAEDASSAIRERAGQLVELIRGPMTDAYTETTSAYDRALGQLRRAGSGGSREESRAAKGIVEHAAYVAERDARDGLLLALTTLENARNAGVSVDGLDEVRELHAASEARAEELRASASDSLSSSGVRGDAGEGYNRLAETLRGMAPETGEGEE